MKRRGPRKVYNYEFIIHDCELDQPFAEYCFQHSDVKSKRRLARCFLRKFGFHFEKPCYELGREQPFLEWVSDQVNKGEIIVED